MDIQSEQQQIAEINAQETIDDPMAKRRAYYRQYYRAHANEAFLVKERTRKQQYYERNREQVLAKAKAKYAEKKQQSIKADQQ